MMNFLIGIALGMYIMYELLKSDVKFSFKWNWDDEEEKQRKE